MKKQIFLIALSLIFSANLFSQQSWVKIYEPSGWKIQTFYKVHNTGSPNSIYIQQNTNDTLPNPENGAVKKYSRIDNSWTDPANGFLNSNCGFCIDPPFVWNNCYPVTFFMISPTDNNFILNYLITPCASCPDAGTYFTHNAGSSRQSLYYLFGCGGSLFFPNGGDIDENEVCYYSYPIFQSGYTPGIFKSFDRGVTWFQTDTIADLRHVTTRFGDQEMNGGFMKVSPFNSDYIFAAHRDYMMLSTEGGFNFFPLSIPPLKEMAFDYNENIIYGVTQNTIYKSVNNGISWTSSNVIFNLNTIEVSPDNSNIIYAGSQTGLYRSTDHGTTWNLYNNSFSPSREVVGISKDPNSGDTVIVSTRDAVYKVFRDYLVGISNVNSQTPEAYSLEQNYPNPFNPSTKIKFSLSKPGLTSLKIYDALGREVSEITNEFLNAGNYEYDFNGSDFSSGIYYYKIVSNDFSQTRKMILSK